MDSELAGVIEVTMISGTFLVAFIAFLVVNRRRAPTAQDPRQFAELSDRLQRIEQAVDAIAIEVERVSEAQRFTAKVLAGEQAPPTKLPGRQTTPH